MKKTDPRPSMVLRAVAERRLELPREVDPVPVPRRWHRLVGLALATALIGSVVVGIALVVQELAL